MALILTEEEQLIKTSAHELIKTKGQVAVLRRLRDTKDALGYDNNLWSDMGDLGLGVVYK